MKSELTAKFLQHLNRKKKDSGFTLIELLVVIIIIGILSAIALPSFLNQANKAKQSESKTYIGSMNRAQQAFYLEKNAFVSAATDFGKLGLGVATETANYKYTTADGGAAPPAVANLANTVVATAPLKTYAGGVSVGNIAATSEATTLASLCEADAAKSGGGADAVVGSLTFNATAAPACTAGFTAIK
ncbi:type IV pilin-like G/H family protein [Myxacorys almedinensis]|uniref:Prepilin-type N-terminal cleavage/methylation domain-containing protein n=1 Tax=Myxacorys almedinensis A TaxID=2690445 RepID=A0A8J7Z490_9CYAN|nr:type IV pilin-like G/H family protein [Myxacorys almedinensis]NDJ17591.1 prepilin-type N-terminal cleavage/methylation domain-containing protein [Myxacorys almedinensis A]